MTELLVKFLLSPNMIERLTVNREAVVIVGEVFKPVKQEADSHEDQIYEVLCIPGTVQVTLLRYPQYYQTFCYNVKEK